MDKEAIFAFTFFIVVVGSVWFLLYIFIFVPGMDVIKTELEVEENVESLVVPVDPYDMVTKVDVLTFRDYDIDTLHGCWFDVEVIVIDLDTNFIEHDYLEYNLCTGELFGNQTIVTWV